MLVLPNPNNSLSIHWPLLGKKSSAKLAKSHKFSPGNLNSRREDSRKGDRKKVYPPSSYNTLMVRAFVQGSYQLPWIHKKSLALHPSVLPWHGFLPWSSMRCPLFITWILMKTPSESLWLDMKITKTLSIYYMLSWVFYCKLHVFLVTETISSLKVEVCIFPKWLAQCSHTMRSSGEIILNWSDI